MQVGSKVLCVNDFGELAAAWGLPYPKIGDILTISGIEEHPVADVRCKNIVLLNFRELPSLPGVCNKTVHGEYNFIPFGRGKTVVVKNKKYNRCESHRKSNPS